MTRMEITQPIDIEPMVYTIRKRRVIIDRDLAHLYGVKTFRFNEAVKRKKMEAEIQAERDELEGMLK